MTVTTTLTENPEPQTERPLDVCLTCPLSGTETCPSTGTETCPDC